MKKPLPLSFFQAALDQLPTPYSLTTRDGSVLYCNQSVLALGLSVGDMLFEGPLGYSDQKSDTEKNAYRVCWKDQAGVGYTLEGTGLDHDGQAVIGWHFITKPEKDIVHKRLDGLVDNMPAYVFSKDRQGRYTYVNKMLGMLHNKPVGDIIGKTDAELFPAAAAEEFTKNDARVFDENRVLRILEKDLNAQTGIEHHYLSVKCPLIGEDGAVEELLGMSIDITEQYRLERAFRENEEKLNSILDNVSAWVYIKDQDLRYTYANQHLCQELMLDRSMVLGKTDLDLFDSKTASGFRRVDSEVLSTRQKKECLEIVEPDKDTDRRYFWTIKVPLLNADGIPHAVLGISTDISEQKRLETALRAKESQLTTILDNLKAHVYIKDVNAIYTYVNNDMCDYIGKPREQIIGYPDRDIFGERAAQRFRKADDEVFNYRQNKASIEKSRDFRTGKKKYFWSVKVPLINELGNPYALLGISTDVTEQKRLEKQLRVMASTDALTGVHNRGSFILEFKRELKRAQRYESGLSLIMLDMDHFKHINDTYGHAVGDEAIMTMTTLCKANLRETDIIARIGGEEFAIILPETPLDSAKQIAERIRKSTEGYAFNVEGAAPCRFTASFGLTTMRARDCEPDDLLKRADIALYDAKTQGRNCVCTVS